MRDLGVRGALSPRRGDTRHDPALKLNDWIVFCSNDESLRVAGRLGAQDVSLVTSGPIVSKAHSFEVCDDTGRRFQLCGSADSQLCAMMGVPRVVIESLRQGVTDGAMRSLMMLTRRELLKTIDEWLREDEEKELTEKENMPPVANCIAHHGKAAIPITVKAEPADYLDTYLKRGTSTTVSLVSESTCNSSRKKDVYLNELRTKAKDLSLWTVHFTVGGSAKSFSHAYDLTLMGYVEDDQGLEQRWRTTAVTDIVEGVFVLTSRSVYRLATHMDMDTSLKELKYPRFFVNKFKNGFFGDWRKDLDDFYFQTVAPAGPSTTAEASRKETPKGGKETRPLKKRFSPSDSKALVRIDLDDTDSPNVQITRSGRCVRPPLAQWAGQHVVFDSNGNALAVQGVTTQTGATLSARIEDTTVLSRVLGVLNVDCVKQQERRLSQNTALKVETEPKPPRRIDVYGSSDEDDVVWLKKQRKVAQKVLESDDNDDEAVKSESSEEKKRRKKKRKGAKSREHYDRLREKEEEEKDRRERLRDEQLWRKEKAEWDRLNGRGPRKIVAKKEIEKSKKTVAPKKTSISKKSQKANGRGKPRKRDEHEEDDESVATNSTHALLSDDDALSSVREYVVTMPETDTEGYEEEKEQTTILEKTLAPNRPFTKLELAQLKRVVEAMDPQNDNDWEAVARSCSSEGKPRTAEVCRETAEKKLGWKKKTKVTTPAAPLPSVTAKQGTFQHYQQSNRFLSAHMARTMNSEESTLLQVNEDDPELSTMPRIADLSADDSLLETMATPPDWRLERQTKKNRRGTVMPSFLQKTDSSEDSDDEDGDIPRLPTPPHDATKRLQQERFVHSIKKGKATSRLKSQKTAKEPSKKERGSEGPFNLRDLLALNVKTKSAYSDPESDEDDDEMED